MSIRALWHHSLVCAISSCSVIAGQLTGFSGDPLQQEAARIHQRVLTVDSHVDTPLWMVRTGFDIGQRHDFVTDGSRVDLPRMEEGGLDAIFFAVFLGQGPRTAAGHEGAREEASRIFEAIHEAVTCHGGQAELAVTPGDAYRMQEEGKRAIFIGIENGYAIGGDLSFVERFYDRGARYMTLCHSTNNDICDSSTDEAAEHQGLSEFGRQVVREMNRLGMMVDVSHVSDETFHDVLKLSRAPVIASHSSARALCDHPRNLSDAMLRALRGKNGVAQVCVLGRYVKKPVTNPERKKALKQLHNEYGDYQSLPEAQRREFFRRRRIIDRTYPASTATVSDVVDHVDHIVRVAGIDHVGIGTDFDGGGGLEGCQDVSDAGNITVELVRRGYTEQQIRKIWGGNLMRVFREVERVGGNSDGEQR